jgi:hypothetical protein
MKENKPDPRADATVQIDLADVAEVVLDDPDVVLSPASGRGTRPPPLPMGVLAAQAPSHAPSQAPAQLPPGAAMPAAPAPRRTMLFALVLVVFFVVSVGGGAIWVRASAPKNAPGAKASAGLPASVPAPAASASASASAGPRVITIGPVDMSSE